MLFRSMTRSRTKQSTDHACSLCFLLQRAAQWHSLMFVRYSPHGVHVRAVPRQGTQAPATRPTVRWRSRINGLLGKGRLGSCFGRRGESTFPLFALTTFRFVSFLASLVVRFTSSSLLAIPISSHHNMRRAISDGLTTLRVRPSTDHACPSPCLLFD